MTCDDCGHRFKMYMVKSGVWWAAKLEDDDVCRPCLSLRLGRPLELSDYIDAPVNWGIIPGLFDKTQGKEWVTSGWNSAMRKRHLEILRRHKAWLKLKKANA